MPSPLPPDDLYWHQPLEMRQLRLSVAGLGPDSFFDAPIYLSVFCVGRSRQAQGCLPDLERRLSLRHFEIELHEGQHRLRNLSINGTTLNGTLLTDNKVEQVLKDGDVIQAGAYTIHVNLTPGPFAGLSEGADNWLIALNRVKPKHDDTD